MPTCPYAQRADDAPAGTIAAVQLQGGNSTGRWIVGPNNPRPGAPPAVTQGALVFQTDQLADAGMKKVNASVSKCPGTFTILGGPPQIVGSYTIHTRPLELNGWKGFSQQLAHTAPKDVNPDTYDDLVTVVLQKDNAILYAGFAQIKNTGERADSGAKAEQVMKQALPGSSELRAAAKRVSRRGRRGRSGRPVRRRPRLPRPAWRRPRARRRRRTPPAARSPTGAARDR